MGDNPGGTAPQLSDGAQSNNGTSFGSMTSGNLVAGNIGGGIYFDGTNDYFDVGTGISPNTSFTEEVWLKAGTQSDAGYHGFLGFDPGTTTRRAPSLWVYQTNRIHGGFGDNTSWNSWISDAGVITSDNATWNHVVTTFDGTSYILYVNGVNVYSTNSFAGEIPYNTPIRNIGRVDNYFRGTLDEIRVLSKSLSPDWIATEYNNQSDPSGFISVGLENSNNILNSAGACETSFPLYGMPLGGTYFCAAPGSMAGNIFNPSAAGAGLHTIIYSYTDPYGCTNTATRDIRVTPVPAAPAAPDVECCIDNISDLTATGTNITWYSDAGLTTPISCCSPFTTGETGVGTYTYYVTQTLNGCESAATSNYTDDLTVIRGRISCWRLNQM